MHEKTMKDYLPNIKPIVAKAIIKNHKRKPCTIIEKTEHQSIDLKNSELQRISRRTKRKFKIQKSIDLHGMTQEQAFQQLLEFFVRCQSQGITNVLVITGGNEMREYVLRSSFQKWIHNSFGNFVVSYTQSDLRHGGQGAFYTVLKNQTPSDS